MKKLINIDPETRYQNSYFHKRFTCGENFDNSTCDMIIDPLQRVLIIQFLKNEGPAQRLVIAKDLLINIPFKYIVLLIEDNYNNPIQFGALDYLQPTRKSKLLLEQFSSANYKVGEYEFKSDLTLEQTIAVCLLHVDKLYLDNSFKTIMRKAILELHKDYV